MFIDWACHINLLVHDPESHILRDFSLPVQKVLVQQVVTFLLDGNNAVKSLSSPAHVKYSIETCGQGFLLPIDEEESISKVINLYRGWIFDTKLRPTPVNNNFQFFLQQMLKHYSLLFEARASIKEQIEKHATLCSTVLEIFSNIGRQIASTLSEETWEIFLKLLIAITDYVLRVDAPAAQEPLQRKLCPQLLKVLFELWLLSRTRNPALWEALKQRAIGWTHHMSLILTWKVTCFALTKRSIAILYGASEGTETVIIKINESVQHIQLEDQYVFYSWHRMLNLIGNPNESIQVAPILLAFINGVEILVNQYLKIGYSKQQEDTRYIAPTGNTILHIFGTWLFDCVHLDRVGFEEGTALALKILCNIMTTKERTEFLPVYMSSFYSCMQRALQKDDRVMVAAILNSTTLLSKTIRGVRCLVPSLFSAIQRILSHQVSCDTVIPAEHLRKASIQIFGSLICLPNHFGDTKFTMPGSSNITSYAQLKQHFSTLLTEALSKEVSASNLGYLLHLSYVWVCEDIENNCDFAKQIIGLIVRKVSQNRWSPEVILAAFQTMSALAQMYSKIEKGLEQANLVVDQLCRFILSHGNPCSNPAIEPIIVLAYKCICNWILVEQWLFNCKETRYVLLTAIVSGLTGRQSEKRVTAVELVEQTAAGASTKQDPKKKAFARSDKKKNEPAAPAVASKSESKQVVREELSENIKEAAHSTLLMLLNHAGNFPTASGAAVVSSLALEQEILNEMIQESNGAVTVENSKEYLRYFITDERVIICVIDRRFHPDGPCCCIIVRDKTGRYAWDSHLTYTPISQKDQARNDAKTPSSPVPVTLSPYQPSTVKPMEVNEISEVLSYLNTCETKTAFKTIESQVQQEYKVLKRNDFRLNSDISTPVPLPADPYIGECKVQYSRMLMSHIGYLSYENRDKLFPLNMTPQFYQALRQLDSCTERVGITVGVLYAQKAQSEDEWYLNEGGSLDYQEFLATLGWGVNIATHRGFLGGMDEPNSAFTVAPYWAKHDTEILFQTTTLVSNQSGGETLKQRLALENSVLVIWTEDIANFQAQQVWKRCRYNIVLIVISPLEFGLYSVRVFSKNDAALVGPLTDGLIVSKDVLGQLVRETAVTAWTQENPDKPSPSQIRQECIDRIYSSFKKICSLEQFYGTQFTSLNPDQIGPAQVEPWNNKQGGSRTGSGLVMDKPRTHRQTTAGQSASTSSGVSVGFKDDNINPRQTLPARPRPPPAHGNSAGNLSSSTGNGQPHVPLARTQSPGDPSGSLSSSVGSNSGSSSSNGSASSPTGPTPPPRTGAKRPPPRKKPPSPSRSSEATLTPAASTNAIPATGVAPSQRPPSSRPSRGTSWLGSARGPISRAIGAPLISQRRKGEGEEEGGS